MKASNKSLETTATVDIDRDSSVVQNYTRSQNSIIINLLPILSMIVAILPGVLRENSGVEIAKIGILTLILTAIASFYIRQNKDTIFPKKFAKSIIVVSYLLSICLMILINQSEIFSFWMIGGLLVAMLIDNKLGLLIHFNLSFILGITLSLRSETVVQLLIIGVLMSLLSGSIKQKSTVVYATIILLSTNITLTFLINNFIFETNINYNYLTSFFSILAVLATAFLLCLLYDFFLLKSKPKEEGMPNNGEIPFSEEESTQYHTKLRTSYELLNEDENELLIKMKDYSETLYKHSMQIADISFRAAQVIGANEMLAKAGGLYHEIGKINGKNYIEEGLKIAEEYAFPKELTSILKQHNIKYEKPTSVEATIVMLSDNVVSTIEYIEKTEDHKFTTNKIIDNVFQMRMEKGTFDNSGLSVKNFKQLKDFYQQEYITIARP